MEKPKHHIFVCTSSRMVGEPKGVCAKKDGAQLIQYIESEVDDRGMEGIAVSNTGCLKMCDRGPIMVIYPENYWYGRIDEAAIDRILDALENGEAVEELLLT